MFLKTDERTQHEKQENGLAATVADCETEAAAATDRGTAANTETATDDMEAAVRLLIERNISVSAMESCTSGLFASGITDTEGASAVFKGSFVTYSNEAKVMQGVPEETIAVYGVYSLPVAEAMAEACREAYGAQIGIGVTGTTGNTDSNNSDSVPGEVYYAILWNEQKCLHTLHLETAGLSRQDMKRRIVAEMALTLRQMLTA
ncbi:MAG: CinA family protein [Clostridiales bacterium]|nr:CinA family protein [Clostridiales bacterium]